MRITFRQLNNDMQRTLNNRYGDLARLQEMLATGKRLLRPSDDPVGVSNDLKLRGNIAQLDQYRSNVEDAQGFMQSTDTAMTSMDSIMQRLRELAIQGSSDTIGPNERLYLGREVEQLLRQMISLGNGSFKGDYIFGGTQTKIAPFPMGNSQAGAVLNYTQLKMANYNGALGGVGVPAQIRDSFTGAPERRIIPGSFSIKIGAAQYVEGRDYTVDYVNGTVTPLVPALAVDVSDGGTFAGPNYQMGSFSMTFDYITTGQDIYGDPVVSTGDVVHEIEEGMVMPINISAEELGYDPTSGKRLMDTIITFGQNLLQNNRLGINSSIDDIDIDLKMLLSAQTKNGSRVNRLETTLDRNEAQTNETTRLQSDIEDAEFADTAGKFSLVQTIYQAALKSASQLIQPSLANFL